MSKRKNVLILMADQLRRHSLSCYGDPNIKTPNIDALARSGHRFTQANTTYPICVPARFTFMTGEYAHTRFIPAIEWRMSPSEVTMADYFNEAGYHTCYIGKWHLYGGHGLLPDHSCEKANKTPIPKPFQGRWKRWLAFDVANNPFNTHYFEDDDPTPLKIEGYQTDGLADLCINYLNERKEVEEPFCCVLSVEPPHFPMEAPKALIDKWLNTDIELPDNFMDTSMNPLPGKKADDIDELKEHIQRYYAMLDNLDQNVGRILDSLRSNGQWDNTIIIFLSDHGEMQGAHSEFKLFKDHPYEESVGIPLIIRNPDCPFSESQIHSSPTCMEDVLPTTLALADIAIPDSLPGVDLSRLMTDSEASLDRPGVLLEFVHDFRQDDKFPYNKVFWRAFRSERYKYIVLGGAQGGEPCQFYDLKKDPLERINLIDSKPHQQEILQHHIWLKNRLEETLDHFVLKPAFGVDGLNQW